MAKGQTQQQKSVPSTTNTEVPAKVETAPTVEAPKMDGVTADNFDSYTAEQLIKGYGTKSNAIRGLSSLGLKPGPISKKLGIRYQHARNVLSRPLKRVIAEQRKEQNAASAGQTQTQQK